MDITRIVIEVIAFVLFSAVLMYVTAGLINLRKAMNNSSYGWSIKFLVEALCDAAELMYDGPGRGNEKLEWVLSVVEKECEKKGITFDIKEVSDMIDTFVKEVINRGKSL